MNYITENKSRIELACIIDDDTLYVSLVKKIIKTRRLCKELVVFENGQEALLYFENLLKSCEHASDIPEIIFLDLNMPVMDGWEFLEKFTNIKNKFQKVITLYVVSSSINPIDITKVKKMQEVEDYLVKPITIKDLEHIFIKATE